MISSINSYNANFTQTTVDKFEQSKVNSFQEALDKAVENKDEKELKEACKEFETYFINYMFKQMQNSVYSINKGNELIKRSQGEQVFTEMLNEEYSKVSTEHGGIGLSDMMYKQLSRNLKTVNEATTNENKI